ncbi:prepilin-type N-terminal cleavage/methylation domain-containing protein [Clostridium perfringens]|uniref:prepilin-type N-terminal cleavage/methylation domain-containing protein n=1 Tax=Clostridium perfringens TaxID=1502 RepID=UPI0039E8DE67
MKKVSIRSKRRKKGFTLIELIIVVAIIAILAAIAIPNFLAIQRKARIQADVETGKNLFDATSALIAENKIKQPLKEEKSNGKTIDIFVDKSKNNIEANDIINYMQNTPIPQSVKNGYFAVAVEWDKDKPNIRIGIFNDKNNLVGTVYPSLDLK